MRRAMVQAIDARLPRRAGFTLLEVLIVLVLIAVAAGMIVPTFVAMYERHRLREAADGVRQALADARVRAAETGLIHQFRFEPGGSRYLVAPFELSADGPFQERLGALPDSFRFELPMQSLNGILVAPAASSATGGAGRAGGILAWSPPLLFAPDGTATDSRLCVVDDGDQELEISIRPLTGAATIGELAMRPGR